MAGWLKKLSGEVAGSIRSDIVGWIGRGIVALVIAVPAYYFGIASNAARNMWADWFNIDSAEALSIARTSIGRSVLWAVPFRNWGDSAQYIAVWADNHANPKTPCGEEPTPGPPCDLVGGSVSAYLLIGDEGIYEVVPTYLTALTGLPLLNPLEFESTADNDAAARRFLSWYGVTDRNDDGIKEILSIANPSAMTDPQQIYLVSLFDSVTRQASQLRVDLNNVRASQSFVRIESADASLRAWLAARFTEISTYITADGCARELAGKLDCPPDSEAAHMAAEAAAEQAEQAKADETRFALLDALVADWTGSNGSDFVDGKMKLTFRDGTVLPNDGDCYLQEADLEWVNVFKGPLVVNDRSAHKTAALYVQDGDHHREIPNIIVGRRYLWLSLAKDGKIVAIDRSDNKVALVTVKGWKGKVPDHEGEPGMERATKEQQIYTLAFTNGRLSLNGKSLSLQIAGKAVDQADEFVAAMSCSE